MLATRMSLSCVNPFPGAPAVVKIMPGQLVFLAPCVESLLVPLVVLTGTKRTVTPGASFFLTLAPNVQSLLVPAVF